MSEKGESPRDEDSAPDSESAPAPETQALEALQNLLGNGAGLARDYLDLLAIEGRLAGRSLVLMLALSLVLALLLVSAWLFFGLAASAWLIEQQWLSVWQAMLSAALAHALMAWLAWLAVRRLSNNLGFGAFRKALARTDPAAEAGES
jgi:hypothetical protein